MILAGGAAGTSGETFTELMDHVAQGQDVPELLAGNRDRGHCAVAAALIGGAGTIRRASASALVSDAALMPGNRAFTWTTLAAQRQQRRSEGWQQRRLVMAS